MITEHCHLESDRLIFRPWRLRDVDAVYAYTSDEQWSRYMPVSYPLSASEVERFVAGQILLSPDAAWAWAITLDGGVIGSIDLHFSAKQQIAELGYGIAREWWGRGFGTEAVQAVVQAAFDHNTTLNRIRAPVYSANHASIRVLEKIGFRREALLRSNDVVRDAAMDEVIMGLHRDDWVDGVRST